LAQLGGEGEAHLEMDDFYGLAARRPVAAACFSLFLLSLLGLPATAGFMGKFYIFDAAVASHLVWLAVFLALNTTIGAFYYLRVIVAMYMREPHPGADATAIPLAVTLVLAVAAFGTVYLGIFPGRIMAFASHAAQSLPLH
jgi:NADH-quinone oxidoreductase subunit N